MRIESRDIGHARKATDRAKSRSFKMELQRLTFDFHRYPARRAAGVLASATLACIANAAHRR